MHSYGKVNLDDLRFFLALARHGRMVAAGERLGVEHTTVSRRVAALEKAVGHRLFERTPTGWTMTGAGRRLLPHAERIEAEAVLAFTDADDESRPVSGLVRLIATDAAGSLLVTPAARAAPCPAPAHRPGTGHDQRADQPPDGPVRRGRHAAPAGAAPDARQTARHVRDAAVRVPRLSAGAGTHPYPRRPRRTRDGLVHRVAARPARAAGLPPGLRDGRLRLPQQQRVRSAGGGRRRDGRRPARRPSSPRATPGSSPSSRRSSRSRARSG